MDNEKANGKLLDAALRGDVRAARAALAAGADVNARSLEGDTAIHLAARRDMIESFARQFAETLTPATAPKAIAIIRKQADAVSDGDFVVKSPELLVSRLFGRMSRIFFSGLAEALERQFRAGFQDQAPRDYVGVVTLLLKRGGDSAIPNIFNETAADWMSADGQILSLFRKAVPGPSSHADRETHRRDDDSGRQR